MDMRYLQILEKLGEHERRLAGINVRGKVLEVDAPKRRFRMSLGVDEDGKQVPGPWMVVPQIAGDLKVHSLPVVGQTMEATGSAGDLEQASGRPFYWSDDFQSPSDSGDEHVLTFGDLKLTLHAGGISLSIGGTSFEFSANGMNQTGGRITHDDKVIDATHTHDNVKSGSDTTGEVT
jgi:phage baseplate assembly protein gpV